MGQIAVRAILIVETITDGGHGLRYVMSEGTQPWQAVGMLRSVLNHIEHADLASWPDDD